MVHLKITFLLAVAMMAMTASAQCNADLDCTCSSYCNDNYGTKVGYCTAFDGSNLNCNCIRCSGKDGNSKSAELKEVTIPM